MKRFVLAIGLILIVAGTLSLIYVREKTLNLIYNVSYSEEPLLKELVNVPPEDYVCYIVELNKGEVILVSVVVVDILKYVDVYVMDGENFNKYTKNWGFNARIERLNVNNTIFLYAAEYTGEHYIVIENKETDCNTVSISITPVHGVFLTEISTYVTISIACFIAIILGIIQVSVVSILFLYKRLRRGKVEGEA
ncbi:hypothetical protein DRO02_02515 [archaeon]|nr:MAG: hypothetical protein DRO21_04075 [archaeon]RLG65185.1 MAG: hypothetical protein DRO02_02515 [archaeon]HDM24175.1 hypothetical protein [Candidatus Bathyarchaeota archaeon]